jgi:hypothetical protein
MPFPLSRRALSGLLLPALPVAASAQQGGSGSPGATQPARAGAAADPPFSSAQLAERALHRRAVEAVIWGISC